MCKEADELEKKLTKELEGKEKEEYEMEVEGGEAKTLAVRDGHGS